MRLKNNVDICCLSLSPATVGLCSLDLAHCPELNLKCLKGASSLCTSSLYTLKELGENTSEKAQCVFCHVGRAVSTNFWRRSLFVGPQTPCVAEDNFEILASFGIPDMPFARCWESSPGCPHPGQALYPPSTSLVPCLIWSKELSRVSPGMHLDGRCSQRQCGLNPSSTTQCWCGPALTSPALSSRWKATFCQILISRSLSLITWVRTTAVHAHLALRDFFFLLLL